MRKTKFHPFLVSALLLTVICTNSDCVAQPSGEMLLHDDRGASRPISRQAAVPMALAQVATRLRLDQPLFVVSYQASESQLVEFFAIPEAEFGASQDAITNAQRRLATVKIMESEVVISWASLQSIGREVTVPEARMVSAIAFLGGRGALPARFRLRTQMMQNGDCHVEIVSFPVTPGAHTTIVVNDTGLKLRPGT